MNGVETDQIFECLEGSQKIIFIIQRRNVMKAIKSVSVGSFVLYGAVLAAFWTFAFGLSYWIMGWIFGAQSWWIDMKIGRAHV